MNKIKKKYASAEAKHNAEMLSKDWDELKKKYEPKKMIKKVFKIESLSPQMSTPRITNNTPLPSLVTPGGNCAKKESISYTGDAMLGIAVLHKSNGIPVFSTEEIHDIGKMRR